MPSSEPVRLAVADPAVSATHPGAALGVLALAGVANPAGDPAMGEAAAELERELRTRFGALDRAALAATPPLPAYAAYYKRFGQRYHVAMQLESVARKGKPIPRVAALVEAMFVAELRHLILTAGHDLDAVDLPLRLGVGSGAERFRAPAGQEAVVKTGDLYVADAGGVLSAIVTGPSDRARIGPGTRAALFVAYAVPGVAPDTLARHLDEIEANVRRVAPNATRLGRELLTAGGAG